MTFFSGSPLAVGLAIFASTILNYRESVYLITTMISNINKFSLFFKHVITVNENKIKCYSQ